MPALIVLQPFDWAHGGMKVERFEPSADPVDMPDDCAEAALQHGLARLPDTAPITTPVADT